MRRRQVVDAVLEILERQGWDALTMKTVSDRAGVSTGILAHYFGNKDGMVRDAIRDAYRRFSDDVARTIEERHTPRAKLIGLIERLMPPSPTGVPDWQFWFALWGRAAFDESIRVELQDIYRQYAVLVRGIVAEGIREGVFRSDAEPAVVADQFVALADGLALRVQIDDELGADRLRFLILSFLSAQLGSDLLAETPVGRPLIAGEG